MGSNRLYARGWRAQFRLVSRARLLPATAELAAQVDRALRRALSVERFVVRLDSDTASKELVIRIVALRHEPTQRTDTAVLPLLRRMFPEATKGEWERFPADARGLAEQ